MKTFLSIILMFLFISQLQALVWINDLQCPLSENPEKSLLTSNVITGSIHFLKSKSYADLLLYEYEKSALQTLDYSASLDNIEKAIYELELAKIKYNGAINIGKRIGYNENKINWFKTFYYDEFIQNNNFNKDIAQKAKSYLIRCDILGIYQKCVDDMDEILSTLNILKDNIKSGKKPEIVLAWKLLQLYSEAALFGNYATMMGTTILGQCEEGVN